MTLGAPVACRLADSMTGVYFVADAIEAVTDGA
jgi:hypothetical protein